MKMCLLCFMPLSLLLALKYWVIILAVVLLIVAERVIEYALHKLEGRWSKLSR